MTKILTVVAELAAVGLVAAGVYLSFGEGPALIVAGSLILAGIELYGIKAEPEEELDDDQEDEVSDAGRYMIGEDGYATALRVTTELDDGRTG